MLLLLKKYKNDLKINYFKTVKNLKKKKLCVIMF